MALLAARRKGAMKHRNIIIYRRNSIHCFVVGLADVCGNVFGRRPMCGGKSVEKTLRVGSTVFAVFGIVVVRRSGGGRGVRVRVCGGEAVARRRGISGLI